MAGQVSLVHPSLSPARLAKYVTTSIADFVSRHKLDGVSLVQNNLWASGGQTRFYLVADRDG